jgi:serine phosphatase RsbU (regulator of sigma subunit)
VEPCWACCPGDEFYGEDRFVRLLRANASLDAKSICETVAQAVGEFQAGKLNDDVTVMALERKTARHGLD